MNAIGIIFGVILLATGAAGWVLTTRVNGNPFAGVRERAGGGGFGPGEDVYEAQEGEETFSFEGKMDYKPGAKRRLLATVMLILLVCAVGAIVAALVGLIVWLVNSAVLGYVNSG